MRIAWVNPSFGEYRVPVYRELDVLAEGGLHLIYSASRTREAPRNAAMTALGARAVGLEGERGLGLGADATTFSNRGVHLPYQPGLLGAILAAEPECVIAEGFFQWTPAALAAKFRRGVPMVIAYERTAHTERNAGLLRTAYRRALCKAVDAIVCNGSLSRDYCTSVLRFPAARIVTGAMAADGERMAAAAAAGGGRELDTMPHPRFLFAGRLVALKGGAELLEGWARALAAKPDLGSLAVVGDGPERSRLEAFARERRLKNVRFLGAVEHEAMPGLYAACDALVMPTLEDNWSLVVPEAMACGKPVLCSVFNGCWPELVRAGLNGWLFDPRDPDGTAAVLAAASAARDRFAEMGAASRGIVADYTPRHAAAAVMQACRVALAHRRRGHA